MQIQRNQHIQKPSLFVCRDYSDKTEQEKKRIVDSFPALNPKCKIDDIMGLKTLIEEIQKTSNARIITKQDRDYIIEKLSSNKALPIQNRETAETLADDLILASLHKSTFYSGIGFLRTKKINYFNHINHTETIKKILKKIDQNYCLYPNGDLHIGSYDTHSRRTGYGTFTYYFGDIKTKKYEGYWLNETFHGQGTCKYFFPLKERYEGSWEQGKRHGMGTHIFADKSKYEGHWKRDMRQGDGTLTFQTQGREVKMECGWKKDAICPTSDAKVTITSQSGTNIYEGIWTKAQDKLMFTTVQGRNFPDMILWLDSQGKIETIFLS